MRPQPRPYTGSVQSARVRTAIPGEQPLNPAARAALVVSAAATILLFYVAAIASLVLLGLAIAILCVVVVGAARFGLADHVVRALKPPAEIFGVLARNLWLPTSPVYHLALERDDAPALYAMVEELAQRMEVAPPREILLEMNAGAWVMLGGFGRGRGRTKLGIGFDLLAGLTTSEVEAVIAHELSHARLVRRGFSRWLKKGLARVARTADELSARAEARRSAQNSPELALRATRLFDNLAMRAASLVATYSRQDEFEADRGAADCCGAGAMRSALQKLERLDFDIARLPWSERLARIHADERFAEWLVAEIARLRQDGDNPIAAHDVDSYSTHPSLRDRLAALPTDPRPTADGRPGIELVAAPDRIAARLAVEIQRVLLEEERGDSRRLARETRKLTGGGKRRQWRWYAVLLVLVGVLIAFAAPYGSGFVNGAIAIGAFGAAVHFLRRSAYREPTPLPVPRYGTLTNPRPPETKEQLAAAEESIAAELERATVGIARGRERHDRLIGASYAALGDRDYLRAHVAARLALDADNQSVPAALGYAVAAAGLGNAAQARQSLAFVREQVGLRTPMLRWGAAWTLSLLEDRSVEGLLQRLHDDEPKVATYALLLGLAQLNRHKVQSAIRSTSAGCVLEPRNATAIQLLAHTYLMSGRVRDAEIRMRSIHAESKAEPEAAYLMLRINLMKRDEAGAAEWAAIVENLDADGRWRLALAEAFSAARVNERAEAYFAAAVTGGYGPEGNFGLAGVAIARGDGDGARRHLLNALKLRSAKLTGGRTRGALFHAILDRLNTLDERRLICRAWAATFPAESSAELAGASVLVYAPTIAEARERLGTVVGAMQEADAPFDARTIRWKEAPHAQQPVRPVWPGVQLVLS